MTRKDRSKQAAVSRVVLCCAGVLWMLGCGGNGDGLNSPPADGPSSPSVPDIAGLWTGIENVEIRGGSDCGNLLPGPRTGPMFEITQNGAQVSLLLLVNCTNCRFSGSILPNGALSARASRGAAGSVLITGQITGDRMIASRYGVGFDCDATAHYDLTRE